MTNEQFEAAGLPEWHEIVKAHDWIGQGCPIFSKVADAKTAVRVLSRLFKALPKIIPQYAFGSPEWKARLNAIEESKVQSLQSEITKRS